MSEFYRHKKRGSLYQMVGRAGMQISASLDAVVSAGCAERLEKISFVVYRSLKDDTLWVRPESEFHDGRFESVGRHYLKRSDGLFWGGGARGWKTTVAEAHFYTEETFAERDYTNAFPRNERVKISIEELS